MPTNRLLTRAALNARTRIAELGADRVHGAAWITMCAAEILQELTGSELREAALAIVAAQPSMAPLFSLANRVLVSGSAQELVPNLQQAFASCVAEALQAVHGVNTVLTHSRSGTVEQVLLAARRRVICTESQPLGEGIALAAVLKDAGIDVRLIRNEDAPCEIAQCDLVMVGADAVSPLTVVNKIGTERIARAAADCGRPFYITCTLDKLIPKARAASDLFDETPLDLVTAVITERGRMNTADVRAHVESLQIDADLKELL